MNKSIKSNKNNLGISIFFLTCASLSGLLPIHPSIQSFWYVFGIPSAIGVALLFGVSFFWFVTQSMYSKRTINIFIPFLIYLTWMLFSSIYSPAVGTPNWWDSARGLIVLSIMLIAACIAAKSPKVAAISIIICGFIALIHYCYLFIFSQKTIEYFGAIASIGGIPNYQSTSFYIGIVGIFGLTLIEHNFKYFLFGILLFLTSLILMSTVGYRSTFIALIILLIILFIILVNNINSGAKIFYFSVFSVIVLITLFIIFIKPQIFHNINDNLIIINRFLTLFSDNDPSHRIFLFNSALSMWLFSIKNFFIGGGLAAYPIYLDELGIEENFIVNFNEGGWYPHNFLLESLAEGGIISIIPLGFLFVKFVKCLKMTITVSIYQLFLKYFASYSLITYMFSGGVSGIWLPFFALSLYLFVMQDNLDDFKK